MDKRKTLVVSGSAGFIGSHYAKHYRDAGWRVFGIDKLPHLIDGVQTFECDITDWDKMCHIFRQIGKADVVSHQAAQASVPNSISSEWVFMAKCSMESKTKEKEDATDNIIGTINVARLAKEVGARLIYANTGGAGYGSVVSASEEHEQNPESPYALSKFTGEKYIKLLHDNWVSLRYANIYGVGEKGVISKFIKQALNKEPLVIYGDGSQLRDYVYIDDLIRLHDIAIETDKNNQAYNASSGVGTSTLDIAKMVQGHIKCKIKKGDFREGDIQDSVLDNSKAKTLGWNITTPIDVGIKSLVDYYHEN